MAFARGSNGMDLLRLIKSLEEFVYEVAVWLLFYPRTMWRVLRHPEQLAARADAELSEDIDEQFVDVVTPPMFLLLSLLLAHAIEIAMRVPVPHIDSPLGKQVFASDTNLLIFRVIAFSLFPLLMSSGLLRRQHRVVDRNTLRRPFYAQCFFTAPLAVFTSLALILMRSSIGAIEIAGFVLWPTTVMWYLVVEANWFQARLPVGGLRAFAIAARLFAFAMLISVVIALFAVGFDAGTSEPSDAPCNGAGCATATR
jgi:hypothetical protein